MPPGDRAARGGPTAVAALSHRRQPSAAIASSTSCTSEGSVVDRGREAHPHDHEVLRRHDDDLLAVVAAHVERVLGQLGPAQADRRAAGWCGSPSRSRGRRSASYVDVGEAAAPSSPRAAAARRSTRRSAARTGRPRPSRAGSSRGRTSRPGCPRHPARRPPTRGRAARASSAGAGRRRGRCARSSTEQSRVVLPLEYSCTVPGSCSSGRLAT